MPNSQRGLFVKKFPFFISKKRKKFPYIILTGCSALTQIGYNAFNGCIEAVVKLPASIIQIESYAFGGDDTSYCKKVHVPNETIKQLVMDSGYYGYRIKVKQ